jgi:hypothetical protein
MTPNSNISGGTEKQQKKTRRESGKPKTGLFENRLLVGFRFIENRSVSVSVSVSRRALMQPHFRIFSITSNKKLECDRMDRRMDGFRGKQKTRGGHIFPSIQKLIQTVFCAHCEKLTHSRTVDASKRIDNIFKNEI